MSRFSHFYFEIFGNKALKLKKIIFNGIDMMLNEFTNTSKIKINYSMTKKKDKMTANFILRYCSKTVSF